MKNKEELKAKIEKDISEIMDLQEHLDASSQEHMRNQEAIERYLKMISAIESEERQRDELEFKKYESRRRYESEKRKERNELIMHCIDTAAIGGVVGIVIKHEDIGNVITTKIFNPVMSLVFRKLA